MKAAPLIRALAAMDGTRQLLVHTGQHYDANMSDVFFRQLAMPAPDVNLQVGSGTHAQQTAQIMSRFEPVLEEHAPDMVVVYGDVNSTVAATLVCAKLGIRVAHVEAGLRSFDRTMPEEINRLVTDQLADLLFAPSRDGVDNLLREGVAPERIHLVGNIMIDTLKQMLPEAKRRIPQGLPSRYVLVTLHRPSNVDDPEWLVSVLSLLQAVAKDVPVLFPVHPRTRARLQGAKLSTGELQLLDPMPYLEFLGMQTAAAAVITDSGGIQEETTYLGIPCFTLRENTERPITISVGSNVLIGRDLEALRRQLGHALEGRFKSSAVPELWDGSASQRIAELIARDVDSARHSAAVVGAN
jgi:UDP-N-acetylglucosamine 2-epimerase (non-hydrolysing)